jgi:hypothetical protein
MKLLSVEEPAGVKTCGCDLTSVGGVVKFCAEPVVAGQPFCTLLSHGTKEKLIVEYPAWFVMVPGKGRGGVAALAGKSIKVEEVPEEGRHVLRSEAKPASAWSDLFEQTRLLSTLGKSDPTKIVLTDLPGLVCGSYTPSKQARIGLATEAASPASSTGDDSWVMGGLFDLEVLPKMDAVDVSGLKSPTTSRKSSGANLGKVVAILERNLKLVNYFLQNQQDDLTGSFKDVKDKVTIWRAYSVPRAEFRRMHVQSYVPYRGLLFIYAQASAQNRRIRTRQYIILRTIQTTVHPN